MDIEPQAMPGEAIGLARVVARPVDSKGPGRAVNTATVDSN
jgi:hypothetical protein